MGKTRRYNRRNRRTRKQLGGWFTQKKPLSSEPTDLTTGLSEEDATLIQQVKSLWSNPETMYFMRETGKSYIDVLRKEQNTGAHHLSPEISDVVVKLITLSDKLKHVLPDIKKSIQTRKDYIKGLTKGPSIAEQGLEEATGAIEEIEVQSDISAGSTPTTERSTPSTGLCRPAKDEDSIYMPCNSDNPYLAYAESGAIDGIIETFITRYEYNKYRDLKFPVTSANRATAYKLGLFTLAVRILIQVAKMGITLVGSLSTFGVGGGVMFGILMMLQSFVVNTAGIDHYLNTSKECLQLMKPYKLWNDPKLHSVMLVLARSIKNNPSIIEKLPGFHIKIKTVSSEEQLSKEEYEFLEFRSNNPEQYCSSMKDILNMIFSTSKFTKQQLAHIIAKQLQQVIVESAKFVRSTRRKISITESNLTDHVIKDMIRT